MKKQIIIIHGGDTFDTYKEYLSFLKKWKIDFARYKSPKAGWKKRLSKTLGKNYEVILPDMPNDMNVKYLEWKIWFQKFIPYFNARVILIGHSLGGVFLAKYLSENKFPKRIIATFLVAAPFDDKHSDYSIADFALPKSLKRFEDQSEKIFLYHSEDDPIVPFQDFKKYRKALKGAEPRILKNRGHFNQETLPELVRDIKNLYP